MRDPSTERVKNPSLGRNTPLLPECCGKRNHGVALLFITQEDVQQRPQGYKIVRSEERPARGYPLEVVHLTQIRPRPRQAPKRVFVHNAAYQLHITGCYAVLTPKSASTPRMEGMGDFHPVLRVGRCDRLFSIVVRQRGLDRIDRLV